MAPDEPVVGSVCDRCGMSDCPSVSEAVGLDCVCVESCESCVYSHECGELVPYASEDGSLTSVGIDSCVESL